MKRNDLWWILAYPAYQLIGTIRHEASHALAAWLQGAAITEFVFWPTEYGWGYVSWEGPVTTGVIAAPYLCDFLTFVVGFTVSMVFVLGHKRWIWLNVVVVGILSPLINSAYNYWGGLRGSNNDVGKLLAAMQPPLVHGYFWLTIAAYGIGIFLAFSRSKMARQMRQR